MDAEILIRWQGGEKRGKDEPALEGELFLVEDALLFEWQQITCLVIVGSFSLLFFLL